MVGPNRLQHILYPTTDASAFGHHRLGNLTPSDVPDVLDSILALHTSSRHGAFSALDTPPLCPSFWRGRMGLGKEEQLQLVRPAAQSDENPPVAQVKPLARS
jgi:hypothetical protein